MLKGQPPNCRIGKDALRAVVSADTDTVQKLAAARSGVYRR